jgi:hypothetical protein
VGLGDAFFMGTAATEQFADNWLADGFGVYNDTPTGMLFILVCIVLVNVIHILSCQALQC